MPKQAPSDLKPSMPLSQWLLARDRETGQAVLITGGSPNFEGNSLGRKGSRDWYQYGRWSFQAYWSAEHQIKKSPFHTDLTWISARTKEEAIREYNQTRHLGRTD